jgi:hypothetical protein
MANKQDYLKKLEIKNQLKQKAGVLLDKHPKVSEIVIQMTYFHNAYNPVLMERTVNFFPSSFAYFNMDCMEKNCDEGGFNLTSIVRKQIKSRKKITRGKMVCSNKNGELEKNHASISYKINIKYGRKS